MRDVVLTMDVGGTFVKSALVDSAGGICPETFRKIPVDSQGSRDAILGAFTSTIGAGLQMVEDASFDFRGIGIGMPGPFDYRQGISLMKHKFQGIYGLDLQAEFRERFSLKDATLVKFQHDTGAFLIGEAWLGAVQGCGRVIGITLGTGLGFAFMVEGELVTRDSGMPSYSIWNRPYKGGIVEDVISQRGILRRYAELTGDLGLTGIDVEQLSQKATGACDEASRQVFRDFGAELGSAIRPVVRELQPEGLVLGGQISKSFTLFEEPLKEELRGVPGLRTVAQAKSIDFSALCGAAKMVFDAQPRPAAGTREATAVPIDRLGVR